MAEILGSKYSVFMNMNIKHVEWAGLEANMRYSMTFEYKVMLWTTDHNVWSGVLTFVQRVR